MTEPALAQRRVQRLDPRRDVGAGRRQPDRLLREAPGAGRMTGARLLERGLERRLRRQTRARRRADRGGGGGGFGRAGLGASAATTSVIAADAYLWARKRASGSTASCASPPLFVHSSRMRASVSSSAAMRAGSRSMVAGNASARRNNARRAFPAASIAVEYRAMRPRIGSSRSQTRTSLLAAARR